VCKQRVKAMAIRSNVGNRVPQDEEERTKRSDGGL
jgi:hypothetical protein